MASTAHKTATYADLCRAPSHLVAEILGGVLHTSPRPALPHARVATELGYELVGPFRRGGPGGWLLLGVHAGAAVVRAAPVEAVATDLPPLWGEDVVEPSAP